MHIYNVEARELSLRGTPFLSQRLTRACDIGIAFANGGGVRRDEQHVQQTKQDMKILSKLGITSMAIVAAAHLNSAAISVDYSFVNITGNSAFSAGTAGQYSVTVTDDGVASGQVKFVFQNSGPAASSITDVYFDDGTLLGLASVIDGPVGVDFSEGANPGNLPGGNTLAVPFVTTKGFLASSDSPTQPNGVNPGEWVAIVFDLINGHTADSTIAALNGGTDLRIGIKVQGFANGESEGFINNGPRTNTPDGGATAALLGVGLLGLAGLRRKS